MESINLINIFGKEVCDNFSKYDYNLLNNSLILAEKSHKNQKRKSGEPYIIHPIAIAKLLFNKYSDIELTVAAFLHDAVEDCDSLEINHIYEQFGNTIGFLVDSVNKKEKSFHEYPNIYFDDKIERLIWAGIKDIRVFLLKIADREHNLETLRHLKHNKQLRMAFESQAVFEPLKEILDYNSDELNFSIKNNSLKYIYNNFKKKINQNNLKTPLEIKNFLFKYYFNNFDEKSFNIVYRNSSNVIWRVEGIEMYKKICSQDLFKDKINIINVKSNGVWTNVYFKFKKGLVSKNKNIKLNISSYNSK